MQNKLRNSLLKEIIHDKDNTKKGIGFEKIIPVLTEVLNIRVSNFVTLLIVAVAFALSIPAIDFFRVWAVGYYYFIAACLVFDIISLFIKNDFFKKAVHTGLISAIVVGLLIITIFDKDKIVDNLDDELEKTKRIVTKDLKKKKKER